MYHTEYVHVCTLRSQLRAGRPVLKRINKKFNTKINTKAKADEFLTSLIGVYSDYLKSAEQRI